MTNDLPTPPASSGDAQESAQSDLYYLQDSRSYVGNDMLFWAYCGYTTDLSKARTFTRADAILHHEMRETDIPWPKAYIDARTRPAVDMQYCKRAEALSGTGIKLVKPRQPKNIPQNCVGCGKFLTEAQIYGDCPHCGVDNRP